MVDRPPLGSRGAARPVGPGPVCRPDGRARHPGLVAGTAPAEAANSRQRTRLTRRAGPRSLRHGPPRPGARCSLDNDRPSASSRRPVGPKGAGRLAWWGRRLFGQTGAGGERPDPGAAAGRARQVPPARSRSTPSRPAVPSCSAAARRRRARRAAAVPVLPAGRRRRARARWRRPAGAALPRQSPRARGTARPGRPGWPSSCPWWSGRRRSPGSGALLALALLQAAFLAALGAALPGVLRLPRWPLWAAAAVGGGRRCARVPFGGFPWGRLGLRPGRRLLTPLAALGGAPLVSFVVALLGCAAGAGAAGPRRRQARRAVGVLVVAAGAALAGAALVPLPVGRPTPVRGRRGAGQRPRLGLDFNAQRRRCWTTTSRPPRSSPRTSAAGRAERPTSCSGRRTPPTSTRSPTPTATRRIDGAVTAIGVPVLVGRRAATATGRPGEQRRHRLGSRRPDRARATSSAHPVPFGEYIPLRSLVRRSSPTRSTSSRATSRPGTASGVLDVGRRALGDVICFEVAYDDIVRDVVTGGRGAARRARRTTPPTAAPPSRAAAGHVPAARGRARPGRPGRLHERHQRGDRPRRRLSTQRTGSSPGDVLSARVPARTGTTLATRVGARPSGPRAGRRRSLGGRRRRRRRGRRGPRRAPA